MFALKALEKIEAQDLADKIPLYERKVKFLKEKMLGLKANGIACQEVYSTYFYGQEFEDGSSKKEGFAETAAAKMGVTKEEFKKMYETVNMEKVLYDAKQAIYR